MKRIVLSIIMMLFAVAVAEAVETAVVPDIPRYSKPSKTIETESGNNFIITLDSNRTTGYEWQLDAKYDKYAIELVGVEYVNPAGGMPGAGGKENWTFKALSFRNWKVGLHFIYVRAWEKDVPPAKEVEFTVKINRGPVEQRLYDMQRELKKMQNESWDTTQGR